MIAPQVAEQLKDSAKDFLEIVWPIIKDDIGGGTLVPVETATKNDFAKELDLLAGIDAWIIDNNRLGIRGIANRTQWFNPKWKCRWPPDTFTIRTKLTNGGKTEVDKRLYALEHAERGFLYPVYTAQAYLNEKGGTWRSVGLIRTLDLYRLFRDKHDLFRRGQAAAFQNLFEYITFADCLRKGGVEIRYHENLDADSRRYDA